MATNTGLKTMVVPTDGITLAYSGETPLTITPKVGTGELNTNDSITLPPGDYQFSFQQLQVAAISYKADPGTGTATITLKGGNAVAGTGPLIVSAKLDAI